jgi:ClpP class serine protease
MYSEIQDVIDVPNEDPEELKNELLEISKKRKSVIMSMVAPYVGQKITPTKIQNAHVTIMEEFSVETAIEKIKHTTECTKLILLLNSPGGSIQSSYKIASALRANFNDITVYIPHIAVSGGTLIALIGNKIVMGMMSQLSPLDPQFEGDDGRAISTKILYDANKNLTNFFDVTSIDDAPYVSKILAEKYDPVKVFEARSSMALMEQYICEILKQSGYLESESRKISDHLVRGFSIHEEVINEKSAEELGLKVVSSNEFPLEWKIMRKWLGTLIIEASGIHLVRYYIHPELNIIRYYVHPELIVDTNFQRRTVSSGTDVFGQI